MGSTLLIPRSQVDYLVSKGSVVVLPEYRLAPQLDIASGPIQDAKEAFVWAQETLPTLLRDTVGVKADGKRIVSIGWSAGSLLALATGLLPNPPLAILDFYGAKYLGGDWHKKPFAGFSQIPALPEEFLNKAYDGSVPVSTPPMFVNGKPALHDPRAAWFITQLKNDTSVSAIMPDGDDDFDVSKHLAGPFPPTFFVHGTADPFVPHKLSIQAHEELKNAGNESEILLAEGLAHTFDLGIDAQDTKFINYVAPALDFVARHVRISHLERISSGWLPQCISS